MPQIRNPGKGLNLLLGRDRVCGREHLEIPYGLELRQFSDQQVGFLFAPELKKDSQGYRYWDLWVSDESEEARWNFRHGIDFIQVLVRLRGSDEFWEWGYIDKMSIVSKIREYLADTDNIVARLEERYVYQSFEAFQAACKTEQHRQY